MNTRFLLLLLLTLPFLSGCWATWGELKKERLLREELATQFRNYKRKQRSRDKKLLAQIDQERARQKAYTAQLRAENVKIKKELARLDKLVKQGQGGVIEVFATIQQLQKRFTSSISQVENLQKQIQEMLQKQPEQQKLYQELQKRYEALLKNQKALAEQAIPARLFSRAKKAFKDKKNDEALKGFRTFTRRFGTHPLADNAYIYIGDILRAKGNENEAILSYSKVLKDYPHGGEAPVALFRLGSLHYKQGHCRQGRGYFRKLRRYRRHAPSLAREARNFIRNWRSLCKRSRRSRRRRRKR